MNPDVFCFEAPGFFAACTNLKGLNYREENVVSRAKGDAAAADSAIESRVLCNTNVPELRTARKLYELISTTSHRASSSDTPVEPAEFLTASQVSNEEGRNAGNQEKKSLVA